MKFRAFELGLTLTFPAGKTPAFQRENAKCVACHGQRLQPIIDHYPFWPGWYGTAKKDDYKEVQDFKAFQTKITDTSRYAKLVGLSSHFPNVEGIILTPITLHNHLVETDFTIKMANQEALYKKISAALDTHTESVAMRKTIILA